MSVSVLPTYVVAIHMAGDIETAKRWLRAESYQHGLCVTVSAETFIYTGGEEAGFVVGLVNYPRFPSTPGDIRCRALEVASKLLTECCQRSALVVASDLTEWLYISPPGHPSGARQPDE